MSENEHSPTDRVTIYHDGCVNVLKTLDAIITDPPAGIGFMGIITKAGGRSGLHG